MVEVFRNLDVGDFVKFKVNGEFVRAQCLHKESEPMVFKKDGGAGYYDIHFVKDEVIYRLYSIVH